MDKLFHNVNGHIYYILFGKKGEMAFLCNINIEQYVICSILEENSWWQGQYFNNFEEAYEQWNKQKTDMKM